MLWDKVAEKCTDNGVAIIRNAFVTKIELIENEVNKILPKNKFYIYLVTVPKLLVFSGILRILILLITTSTL